MTTTALETGVAAVVIVCLNTAIGIGYARSARLTIERSATRFGALLVANLLFVWIASLVVTDGGDFPFTEGLFFAFLVTLMIWLYDVFKPVYDTRFDGSPLRIASFGDFRRRVADQSP